MSAACRLHKRGYEPRRGSVMIKTNDATTTDRLRRSPLYLGPVSKLRSQASLHGVNHNMPFPTALKFLFSTFSVLSNCRAPAIQNVFFGAFNDGVFLWNDAIVWFVLGGWGNYFGGMDGVIFIIFKYCGGVAVRSNFVPRNLNPILS